MVKAVMGQPEVLLVVDPRLAEVSRDLPALIAREVDRLLGENKIYGAEHIVRAEAYCYTGISGEGVMAFRLRFHFCCGEGMTGSHKWNEEYEIARDERGHYKIEHVPYVPSDTMPCH